MALVPQMGQQVVCHQIGVACLEFGKRRMDGWATSRRTADMGGSCYLSMCAWDG